jgi:hypothetical protein
VYGKREAVRMMSLTLLWKPLGDWLLFIFAITSRGPIVLMSSDLRLSPSTAIELYCVRTRIEIMFDVMKNCGGESDRPSEAELPPPEAGDAKEGKQSDPKTDAQTQSGEQPGVGNEGQKSTRRPGHGRLGAADYPGAKRVFCLHDQYQEGGRCPAYARGRLYPSRPLVRLRFTGQPLANVTHYELEQLRS